MAKREFVFGRWIDYKCTASGILSHRKSKPSWDRPTMYRLFRVTVAEVEAQAARERKARAKGKRKESKR